jgi:hypothetical protein
MPLGRTALSNALESDSPTSLVSSSSAILVFPGKNGTPPILKIKSHKT